MSDKLRRLQPAAQAARCRQDAAARDLAGLQRRLREGQARLQQLLAFQAEYLQRFQCDGQAGLPARRLLDYTAFLAHLDRNIVQLHGHLRRLRVEFEGKRRVWAASRAKTQALETVMARYRFEEVRAEDRREQAEWDDLTPRRGRGPARG